MAKNKVFTSGRIIGIILMIAGFLVWAFRPLQECAWWNIFCQGGSLILAPLFLIITLVLVIVGVIKLIMG